MMPHDEDTSMRKKDNQAHPLLKRHLSSGGPWPSVSEKTVGASLFL